MKTISKILSIVLCLTMVLGLFVVGASADSNTYTKVTSISDITAGTYVIGGVSTNAIDDGSKYAFMSNVGDGKQRLKGTALTENNGVITTDDTSVVWNLVAAEGGFYLQSAADGKYVKMPALKKAEMVDSASEATVWAVVEYNGGITLKVSNSDEGYMTANRFGSAGSYYLGFAAYKASSQSCPCNLDFYKLNDSGSVTPPPATEETTPSTEATEPSTEATTPSTEATTPSTPSTEAVLKNGDKVVIYAPAYNKALSSQPDKDGSFYQLGVDVTITNGVMTGYGDTEVWTVVDNGDGTFSFEQGGQKIAMGAQYSSMKLGEVNDKWTITSVGTGVYNITNSVRGNSIEWYSSKNNWSTYNKNTTTDDQFFMSFYVVSTTSTPDASEPSTEPSTEATTPVAPAPTGDASFVSVAIAAVVLSALAGTVVVLKKKEN